MSNDFSLVLECIWSFSNNACSFTFFRLPARLLPFVWFSNLKSCYTRLYIPYFIHLLPFPIDSCISHALAYPSSMKFDWKTPFTHFPGLYLFFTMSLSSLNSALGADLLTWPNLFLCSHPICYNLLKLLDILSTLLLQDSNQDNRK